MVNVIPMSGSGSRFAEAGYKLPKPLIPVSGRPMIFSVIDAMPKADRWVFVVREEHVREYGIDAVILSRVPNATIVIDPNPHGQATSCMLALPHVNPDEDMFVAACDNSFLYNAEKFATLTEQPGVDAVLWTFTNDEALTAKPEAWGWVKLAADGETIDDMSVKIPVSTNPLNDHAVVASFYFKKMRQFKEACELMMREGHTVRGEYYVDSLPIFYKKMGLRTVIFDVDLYVGWGKPEDLHRFEEVEYQFQYGKLKESVREVDTRWVRYLASHVPGSGR